MSLFDKIKEKVSEAVDEYVDEKISNAIRNKGIEFNKHRDATITGSGIVTFYNNNTGTDDQKRNAPTGNNSYNNIIMQNGNYMLKFQGDGNFVLYNQTTPLWNSDTNYRPYIRWGGTSVEFDFNTGQITMYNPSFGTNPLWKAFSSPPSLPTGVTINGSKFQLESNGSLNFYPNPSGFPNTKLNIIRIDYKRMYIPSEPYWTSASNSVTSTNATYDVNKLIMENGNYQLIFQGDGNLVLYNLAEAYNSNFNAYAPWNSDTNYRPYIRWGGTSVAFDCSTGQINMYNPSFGTNPLWKAFDVTPSLPSGVTLSNPKFQLENNGTLAFYPNSTQQTIKLDVIANIGGLCVPPYESWKNKDFDNSELSGRTLLFDSNNGVNRTWQTGSYVKFKDRVLIFNYFGQVVIGQPGSIVNGKKTLYVKTNGTIGDKKPLKNTYILNFTNTNNGQAYVMDGNTNINDIIKVNFDSAARIKLEYSISSTNNGVYTYKLRLEPSNSTGGLNSHDNL